MLGYLSKIGKPFMNNLKRIANFFITSDDENFKTSDGEDFNVQP